MENEEFMRMLAAWSLVHESADEGYKAAVQRGDAQVPGEMEQGPEAFVDALAAAVEAEKEKLKAEIASGAVEQPGSRGEVSGKLDDLSFELSELRGKIESMQASIDALHGDAERE